MEEKLLREHSEVRYEGIAGEARRSDDTVWQCAPPSHQVEALQAKFRAYSLTGAPGARASISSFRTSESEGTDAPPPPPPHYPGPSYRDEPEGEEGDDAGGPEEEGGEGNEEYEEYEGGEEGTEVGEVEEEEEAESVQTLDSRAGGAVALVTGATPQRRHAWNPKSLRGIVHKPTMGVGARFKEPSSVIPGVCVSHRVGGGPWAVTVLLCVSRAPVHLLSVVTWPVALSLCVCVCV